MKSVKIIFSILISIFAICPVVASASIVNNNGIEITDEEFERFSLAFDDDYIMNLTEEKYESLLDLDFSDVRKETKYILSAYNPHLNIYSEREVSEEEYNLFNLVILNNNSIERDNNDTAWTRFDGGTFHETSSKKITLNVVGGSTYSYVTLTNTW